MEYVRCVWLGPAWMERGEQMRGEQMRGLGITNPVGTGGVLERVSVWRWCRWGVDLDQGLEVLGGYLCILGSPNVPSCCTLWISSSYRVFVYGKYRNWLSDLNLSRHHPLL